MSKKWVPFYFDGNLAFGKINSLSGWKKIVRAYMKDFLRKNKDGEWERIKDEESVKDAIEILKGAKASQFCSPPREIPAFGFYIDYTEKPTLGEWADEVRLHLEIKPWPRLKKKLEFLVLGYFDFTFRYFDFLTKYFYFLR